MLVVQSLLLGSALAACGGESDSNSGSDDAPDTSGSGGSVATNGSGGSGGDASGGSSSSTMSGSGGTDAGAGGSSATGGSSAGGASSTTASSGGSGGSAGDGGEVQNPVPPPELVDDCEQFCELEVASECPSAPDAAACAGGCELTTRVPECNDELGEFFDCIEEDSTNSCSNEGDVVYDSCVSEQLAAWSCVYQEAPDPGLEEPCESYCGAVQDAMCANDAGDLAGCILYCQSIGTILPECVDPWQTLLECGQGADFECDENGEAQPAGCDIEAVLFIGCVCTTSPELCTE